VDALGKTECVQRCVDSSTDFHTAKIQPQKRVVKFSGQNFQTFRRFFLNMERLGRKRFDAPQRGVSGIQVFSSFMVGKNRQFQPYNSIIFKYYYRVFLTTFSMRFHFTEYLNTRIRWRCVYKSITSIDFQRFRFCIPKCRTPIFGVFKL
jgi:hypothetical protein